MQWYASIIYFLLRFLLTFKTGLFLLPGGGAWFLPSFGCANFSCTAACLRSSSLLLLCIQSYNKIIRVWGNNVDLLTQDGLLLERGLFEDPFCRVCLPSFSASEVTIALDLHKVNLG